MSKKENDTYFYSCLKKIYYLCTSVCVNDKIKYEIITLLLGKTDYEKK